MSPAETAKIELRTFLLRKNTGKRWVKYTRKYIHCGTMFHWEERWTTAKQFRVSFHWLCSCCCCGRKRGTCFPSTCETFRSLTEITVLHRLQITSQKHATIHSHFLDMIRHACISSLPASSTAVIDGILLYRSTIGGSVILYGMTKTRAEFVLSTTTINRVDGAV